MCIYSFKITNASTKMLKESVSNIPMSFYVECKNNETEQQCFDKISRKFRQKYGVIIESADVEQIDESMWDKFKARTAGVVNKVKEVGHNIGVSNRNSAKDKKEKEAFETAHANAKPGETVSVVKGEREDKASGGYERGKLLSILKSKVARINDLITDVSDDLKDLGLLDKLPTEKKYGKNKDLSIATMWDGIKTLAANLDAAVKEESTVKHKAQKTENQKAERPQAKTAANTIAQNGVKSNPIKKQTASQGKAYQENSGENSNNKPQNSEYRSPEEVAKQNNQAPKNTQAKPEGWYSRFGRTKEDHDETVRRMNAENPNGKHISTSDEVEAADTALKKSEGTAATTKSDNGSTKKKRSDAQMAAFAKAQAARKANIERRKKEKIAPSKEVDDARKQAADEYANGNPENEEIPAKKKSSKKDPFAPNPFF